MEKALLTLDEFREYLGIGENKALELVKRPRNGFSMKIGNKWFVHKSRLDKWLESECDKY
ncbi:MAG: helix-turn-helix domain-containing protein [Pseudobutyrivibrio sp.]|nr:helix-turn-helix domain-containing protein [Pseudobutyrivibrio sp.]